MRATAGPLQIVSNRLAEPEALGQRLAPDADADVALEAGLAALEKVPGVLAKPAAFAQIGSAGIALARPAQPIQHIEDRKELPQAETVSPTAAPPSETLEVQEAVTRARAEMAGDDLPSTDARKE